MKTAKRSEHQTNLSDLVRLYVVMLMLAAPQLGFGQGRLCVEFRPSANFPTADFGSVKVAQGGGFEAVGAYRFMPHLSVYLGWGWNQFGVTDTFAGSNTHFEETGCTFGLQFVHPLKDSKLSLLIRGGGVANHIEVENGNGDLITDSGHGIGWQIEGGLAIPVSKKWRLVPSLRYHSLSRNISIGSTETSGTLSYLSLGLGVSWLF